MVRCCVSRTALLDALHNRLADILIRGLEGVGSGLDWALLGAQRGAEEADVAGGDLAVHFGVELGWLDGFD